MEENSAPAETPIGYAGGALSKRWYRCYRAGILPAVLQPCFPREHVVVAVRRLSALRFLPL